MRTWEDYRTYVKSLGSEEKADMEWLEEISHRFNVETIAAMQEAQDIATGKVEVNPQSVDSFFEEMGLSEKQL